MRVVTALPAVAAALLPAALALEDTVLAQLLALLPLLVMAVLALAALVMAVAHKQAQRMVLAVAVGVVILQTTLPE
jgi:hypothetical protein